MTGRMRAGNANLVPLAMHPSLSPGSYRRSHIDGADVAVVLGARLGAARGGLFPDYAHWLGVVFIADGG